MKIKHYDKYGNEFIKFDIIPNLKHVIKKCSSHTIRRKLEVFLKHKHICAICGKKAYYIGYYKQKGSGDIMIDLYAKDGTIFNIDHIIPISKNGSNCDLNKQCTCITCNSKKGDTFLDGTVVQFKSGKLIPYKP